MDSLTQLALGSAVGVAVMGRRTPIEVRISDLRMGIEPSYAFTFVVARRANPELVPVTPRMVPQITDVPRALDWIWRRLKGERLRSPSGGSS